MFHNLRNHEAYWDIANVKLNQWQIQMGFGGFARKNEIKSEKRTQHLYTYEPPFQKSWIRPCKYTKSQYSLTQAILVIQVSLYS